MVRQKFTPSVSESLKVTVEGGNTSWVNRICCGDIFQAKTSQVMIRVIVNRVSEPILRKTNLVSFDLNGTSRKSHLQERIAGSCQKVEIGILHLLLPQDLISGKSIDPPFQIQARISSSKLRLEVLSRKSSRLR